MRFVLARTLNPVLEPVTLAEAKLHLRSYTSDIAEDDLINGLLVAAREWVEDYTGRALVEQRWSLSLDRRIGNAPGIRMVPPPVPANGYGWYTGEWTDSVAGWLLRK